MSTGGATGPGVPGSRRHAGVLGDRGTSGGMRALAAAGISAALGVFAHGLGGGATPHTGHILLAVCLSGAVGWLMANLTGRDVRTGWSVVPILATLTVAQIIGHLTFTFSHGAHSAGQQTGHIPSPAMFGWHAVAIGLAAALLVLSEHIVRIATSRIRTVLRGYLSPARHACAALTPVVARPAAALGQHAPVGLRAPPVVA